MIATCSMDGLQGVQHYRHIPLGGRCELSSASCLAFCMQAQGFPDDHAACAACQAVRFGH
jgi:hypothetical protein